MLSIAIPGFANLTLNHLVLDFNGTLACDGEILPGIREQLVQMPVDLAVHVLTGDTFGRAAQQLEGLPCQLLRLPAEKQAEAKRDYVMQLGAANTLVIGNGRNDRLMLATAALGIAVIGPEGSAVESLLAADLVARDIHEAFDLLAHPLRIVATLRQ